MENHRGENPAYMLPRLVMELGSASCGTTGYYVVMIVFSRRLLSSFFSLSFSLLTCFFFFFFPCVPYPIRPHSKTELSPAFVPFRIRLKSAFDFSLLFPNLHATLEIQNNPGENSQCAKRRLECKYPHISRRGQRKPHDPDADADATTTTITSTCKPRAAARPSVKRSVSSHARI